MVVSVMVFEQIYLPASCLWRFPRASEWLELLQEVERPPGITAGLHQYEAPGRWMCCNKNSQHWNTVHFCLNALSDYPILYSFKKKTQSFKLSANAQHGISSYFTKQSKSSVFLRSLMYSPIIFLSSRGFSLSHWAICLLSVGLTRRPFSCRNCIPFLGFWLNCSVPVINN